MKPTYKYILKHNFLLLLLFSTLGSFLYLLVQVYGTQVVNREIIPATALAYALTVFVVNLWGFGLLYLHSMFSRSPHFFYTKKRRLLTRYYLMALIILIINYLSFVFIRWLFDKQEPFVLSLGGGVLLYTLWFIETIVISLIFIEYVTRNAINLYKEQQQLRKNVEIAQYQAMQNQLDPHFLFNSLSVLISEIEYDPKNAVKFTQNLSEIYRYVLHQQHKMRVTLQEEMRFFDAYIFLFQTRLGNCIQVRIELPPEALSAYVPPLTLQLLLENIFKHNYMSEEEPMKIHIDTSSDGSLLRVSNILRSRKNKTISGRGLDNLATRVQILCSRPLRVDKNDKMFQVTIPLLYE